MKTLKLTPKQHNTLIKALKAAIYTAEVDLKDSNKFVQNAARQELQEYFELQTALGINL